MHTITNWLSSLSGTVIYAVVAGLVFFEDALFFGFVLPGETAAILGGVLAAQGKVSVLWLSTVVVVAAIAGDSVGYQIGRRFGPAILRSRFLRRHAKRVHAGQDMLRRWGPGSVFLGRFVAVLRAMVPALVGMSRMSYRRFLLFNALGAVVWGVGCVVLGYVAGAAYSRVERLVGRDLSLALAGIAIVAVIGWRIRRHFRRRTRFNEDDGDEDPPTR